MNTKHTPGPWSVIEQDVIGSPDPSIGIGSVFPADKSGDGFTYGEVTKANARLIAAAPELLGSLERMVIGLAAAEPAKRSLFQEARAVIAKATGEQA